MRWSLGASGPLTILAVLQEEEHDFQVAASAVGSSKICKIIEEKSQRGC